MTAQTTRVGCRIAQALQQHGVTVEDAAARMGVTPATVRKYLRSRSGLSVGRVENMAQALGIRPGVLLGYESAALPTRPNHRITLTDEEMAELDAL